MSFSRHCPWSQSNCPQQPNKRISFATIEDKRIVFIFLLSAFIFSEFNLQLFYRTYNITQPFCRYIRIYFCGFRRTMSQQRLDVSYVCHFQVNGWQMNGEAYGPKHVA